MQLFHQILSNHSIDITTDQELFDLFRKILLPKRYSGWWGAKSSSEKKSSSKANYKHSPCKHIATIFLNCCFDSLIDCVGLHELFWKVGNGSALGEEFRRELQMTTMILLNIHEKYFFITLVINGAMQNS